ncbi:hypothetical protein FACS1894201_05630 [Bacteroidia bacterium]|nr:hypothetical protein FACS1894201_05630 [Bacteroidia bacterium]
MKKYLTSGFFCVCAIIILGAVARFFTPIPNFTPVAAIALFGGAYLGKKHLAFVIPIAMLVITDCFIGVYDSLTMSAVYASFILTGVIGVVLSKKLTVKNTVIAAVVSSVLFFVITNFATWISGFCGYPMTFGGLVLCYEMALPFFRNEILGTLVYSGVFFGAYELLKARYPQLATITR